MSILIITPLPKERDAFLVGFADLPSASMTLGTLPATHFPDLKLTLALGGAGKAQFALQTTHLLDSMETLPKVVICAGASGALDESLSVGDLVVGVETVEHDYRNRFNSKPRPRFAAHPPTLDQFRALDAARFSFRIVFDTIASGDEDIIEANRRAELRAETGAVAVAWEGAGGGRACRFRDVPYLEIRSISDNASERAPQQFRANLDHALGNLAALIRAWLDA